MPTFYRYCYFAVFYSIIEYKISANTQHACKTAPNQKADDNHIVTQLDGVRN